MKESTVLALSFPVLGFLAACNYDTGECYVRGQDGAGAGGAVIVPPGSGGFGDVPPKPLDANGDMADPCSQLAECTVTWKAGSDSCKNAGATGTCTSLHRGFSSTLDDAKKECERIHGINPDLKSDALSCGSCHWVTAAMNACYDKCDEKAAEGHKQCEGMPKGPERSKCRQVVEEQRGDCYRDCDR